MVAQLHAHQNKHLFSAKFSKMEQCPESKHNADDLAIIRADGDWQAVEGC